jgi:hypothetical protein
MAVHLVPRSGGREYASRGRVAEASPSKSKRSLTFSLWFRGRPKLVFVFEAITGLSASLPHGRVIGHFGSFSSLFVDCLRGQSVSNRGTQKELETC